jgi:hypothetical protein
MERSDSGASRLHAMGSVLAALIVLVSSPAFAADTIAPSTPVSLTAVGAPLSTQIDLSWPAATDNVTVTAYLLERCTGSGCSSFAQVSSVVGLSFANTGLSPVTSYSYRVRARDAANKLGGYSTIIQAATTSGTVDCD